MKLSTILILGATVLATPALAQAAADSNTASRAAGQSANTSSTTPSQSDASTSAGTSSQTAMNDSGAAAAVSSIPDTEKKYRNSSRASDDRKEAETTKELNQQMANANGIPKT